jgi:hypothetical protein
VSDPSATQPWNPYAYVRNNPLTNTDPSGYEECMQRAFDGSCMSGGNGGYSPAVWDNVAETQGFGDARDSCSSGAGCFDENRLEREYERKSAINDAVQKANAERALKQHQENKIRESGGGNGPRTQKLCACAGADVAPGLIAGGAVAAKLESFVASAQAVGAISASEAAALLAPFAVEVAFVAVIAGTPYYVYNNPRDAALAASAPFEMEAAEVRAWQGAIDWLFGKAKNYILQSSEQKRSSAGKMNTEVKRGNAPNGVTRVDDNHVDPKFGGKPHVHFNNGTSQNWDGTIHDAAGGTPNPTKDQRKWLVGHGWRPYGSDIPPTPKK